MADKLFRDQYRLTTLDIIPFFTTNRLTDAQRQADLLIKKDPKLAKNSAIMELAHHNIPGEDTLVFNGLTSVVNRLRLVDSGAVRNEDFVVYQRDDEGLLSKTRLIDLIGKYNGRVDRAKFFSGHRAMTLTFKKRLDTQALLRGAEEYIPTVEVVDMGSGSISSLIWQQNKKNDAGGFDHYTIVVEDQEDLDGLMSVALARNILALSGGSDILKLQTFTPGRIINVGSPRAGTTYLMDLGFAHDCVRDAIPDQLFESEQDLALDLFERTIEESQFQKLLGSQ